MTIPELPPATDKLQKKVSKPEDIDAATNALGIPPRLINFDLATFVDLTEVELGQAVYLPVAISSREGGRQSPYYLKPGEETLAGIFVTGTGIALRYVKRRTTSK